MNNNQNIYDNEVFFEGYKKLRQNPDNANLLEEKPAMLSLCPDINGSNILDLGCGYGENCVTFSRMGAKSVIGIDISEKMLSVANSENRLPNIRYIRMDMTEIDKLDEKFDIVFSSLAVHYIKDFQDLVEKINKILNNSGLIIFSQEHPLTTAPIKGASWTRDENNNILHYNLTDYCRNGERRTPWIVDEVIKYHRCFSEIVNTLVSSGFKIERMLEPIPSRETIEKLPAFTKDFDKPNFLLIRARKE